MNTIAKYSLYFIGAVTIGYFVSKYHEQEKQEEISKELQLIRRLLLNETPLYEMNKPILWIHTKYEVNSRQWKSFYSRNSTDLNMPYIHLTVRTIINQCGKFFNICLIDDQTFSKLIPSWKIDMNALPEPMKLHARMLAMAKLLYRYGGMVVPPSFVCKKPLIGLFESYTANKQPFVVEIPNRMCTLSVKHQQLSFVPSLDIIGVKEKNNPTIANLIEVLKEQLRDQHFHLQNEFVGTVPKWCFDAISANTMNLVNGRLIGTKSLPDDKPILIEDLLSDEQLAVAPDAYGVFLPMEEFLIRWKYDWFVTMSADAILNSTNSIAIAREIANALTDSLDSSTELVAQKTSLVVSKHAM